MTKTIQRLDTVGATSALAVATAGSAAADRSSFNNWYGHDGGSGIDASGLVDRGLALSPPTILTGELPPISRPGLDPQEVNRRERHSCWNRA